MAQRHRSLGVGVVLALLGALVAGVLTSPSPPASAATNEPGTTHVADVGGYGHGYPGSLQFRFLGVVDAGPAGDLYVVERGLDRIRHVSTAGEDLGSWGSSGVGNGQFSLPLGVAVAPDGSVYVADTGNNRIQHFTASGGFLGAWGTNGSGPRQFKGPRGLDVAADGTVYVADGGNDRIQAFTASGDAITAWGPDSGTQLIDAPADVAVAPDGTVLVANGALTVGSGKVQRYSAAGEFIAQWTSTDFVPIALDAGPDGRVYVSDNGLSSGHHRVAILNEALTNAVEFGSPATGPSPGASNIAPGLLWAPQGLAVDGDGVVTVVDSVTTSASRILDRTDWLNRFDDDGEFLTRLGTADTNSSPQLDTVVDVARAPSGDLYLVDIRNHRVLRLTADGAYVSSWGGPVPGTSPGQFNAPESIAVDAGGHVYVADTGNDRVQRFSATGAFEAQWGSSGSGHGQFRGPSGVVVDASGDVFVADAGNDRVQRFSSAGVFEAAWGSSLDDPGDLALGVGPSIYVADRGHGRVLRFTRGGGLRPLFEEVPLPVFSSTHAAAGLATDQDGNLYVSRGARSVDKYSRSGLFVQRLGPGSGSQWAVVVDADRRLVLARQDTSTAAAGRSRISIDQLASGAFATVRAGYGASSGSVGHPLLMTAGVANTGTTTLTGISLTDPNAPGCGGPVPDLAPGEEHIATCSIVPAAPGTVTHAATVASDQTSPMTSEVASVDVSVDPGPVLLDEWGIAGDGPGQLDAPSALTVDHTGDVLVANTGNDVVTRFNGAGALESEFATVHPVGIDVDGAGNVFVARDTFPDLLQKYSSAGVLQWSTGLYGSEIAVGGDGRVWLKSPYLENCGEFTCDVYSETRARRFSNASGAETGSFGVVDRPELAVSDATDRVYVGGRSDGLIYAYRESGGPALGSTNVGCEVVDMDVDAAGRLYVACHPTSGPDVVKVFETFGTLLARWETPVDNISVAPDGTVYVLDATAGRVRRFGFGLAGQVTGSGSGDPVVGAWALAVDPSSGRLVGASTDGDGRYSLAPGLGDRLVGFIDPSGAHAAEWFDDRSFDDPAGADLVAVNGHAAAVADAELAADGRTASVVGTVTEEGSGSPLEGVWVAALDLGDGATARAVRTDGDGHYRIDGLAGRAHLLVAFDASGAHRLEYFDGHGSLGSADELDLVAGEEATADVALVARAPHGSGARIGGLVRSGGQPRRGVLVLAFSAARGSFVRAAVTGGAGRYRLDVPPGEYHLAYLDPSGTTSPEWHRDRPFLSPAGRRTVVAVTGASATVNATLVASGPTGSIGGTVTGPGNEAVSGAWVAVADAATGSIVRGAVADVDGEYVVDGLQAGTYVVLILDPSDAFTSEWHDAAADPGSATPVDVTAAQRTALDLSVTSAPSEAFAALLR